MIKNNTKHYFISNIILEKCLCYENEEEEEKNLN